METVCKHFLLGRKCEILKSSVSNRLARAYKQDSWSEAHVYMFLFYLTLQASDEREGWPDAGSLDTHLPHLQGEHC